MLNIGAGEIAVILVLALLILGPKRLPELARGIGKFLREFRRQTDEVRTTIESEFYRMDRELQEDEPRKSAPLVSSQSAAPAAPALENGAATPSSATANAIWNATSNVVAGTELQSPEAPPTAANPVPIEAVAPPPGKWEE